MTQIVNPVITRQIECVPPEMIDRAQIVQMLTRINRACPGQEVAMVLGGSADAQAWLDFNIERKLGVVAKYGAEIVGLAGWRLNRGHPVAGAPVCAEMVLLYVEPAYRRLGVGLSMCRFFLRACEDRSYSDPTFRFAGDRTVDGLMNKLQYVERARVYGARPDQTADNSQSTAEASA